MANGFGEVKGAGKGLLPSTVDTKNINDYSLSKCGESLGQKSDLINDYSMSKGLQAPKMDKAETKTINGF